MSILVVGSVAFDTVETPFGTAEQVLGGSASFFSVAASFFAPVNLVGVVGERLRREGARRLPRAGPSTSRASSAWTAQTFHWQGKYSYDLNSRETICTDLNVFEFFKPKIPATLPGLGARVPRQHRPRAPARRARRRWRSRGSWPATP